MDTNEKEEKKVKEYPEKKEEKSNIVEEPLALYGTMELDESKHYSYADYLTWFDDRRRQVINGIARLMFAPTTGHAQISSKILVKMAIHIEKQKGKCQVISAPFDVRLPQNGETANDKINTVVQPDICVVCDLSKLDRRGCLGAPDLIVEIQSPSTARNDLTEKFSVYESAGVREYWIVFPKEKAITVFLLQENGKYDKGTTYEFEGVVQSSVLHGLDMDIEELFKDLII